MDDLNMRRMGLDALDKALPRPLTNTQRVRHHRANSRKQSPCERHWVPISCSKIRYA